MTSIFENIYIYIHLVRLKHAQNVCFPPFSTRTFFSAFSSPFSPRFLLPFFPRFLSVFYAFSTLAGPARGAAQLRYPGGRPESLNMGRWPPRPSRSKFIRLSVDYCNGFVKEARILEYGGREGGGRRLGELHRFLIVFYAFSSRFLLPFSSCFLCVFIAFSTEEHEKKLKCKHIENNCSGRV